MVHKELVFMEDVSVAEMIDVVEIMVKVMTMTMAMVGIVVEIMVNREDLHMTTIVRMVVLNGAAIVEVEDIGTMTIIEDIGG
jgi:hypothetical protein